MDKKEKNGGIPARIGRKFSEEVEIIKDMRLRNGKSKERVSTEKISNLVVRHKFWGEIRKHIIEATHEEVEEHGLE